MITSILIAAGVLLAFIIIVSASFRTTVNPNEVHIVQSTKKTTAYGKGYAGNVYYNRPSWFPVIGCVRSILPVNVFDITIQNYQAYDIGRVPFGIDVKAFFRIANPVLAAERISSYPALVIQLGDVLKSSIRSILASADIETILSGRSEFSEQFTAAVKEQLTTDWGVDVVKNIEFMEIRDGENSEVISNIQQKKESEILRDSRTAVAKNNKEAELQEIEAKQVADIRRQEALELVGKRTVEKDRLIGVETERANQQVQEEAKITREREMEVMKVEEVKTAEIAKAKEIIDAEKEAQKLVISAQADKEKAEKNADAIKVVAEAESEKIVKIGQAEGDAQAAKENALVAGKITLMEKMTNNPEYAKFLQIIEAIGANKEVGIAQAQAMEEGLKGADIKYLGNGGKHDPVNSLKDLFTPEGMAGMGLGVETFKEMTNGSLMDIVAKFSKLSPEVQEKITKMLGGDAQ